MADTIALTRCPNRPVILMLRGLALLLAILLLAAFTACGGDSPDDGDTRPATATAAAGDDQDDPEATADDSESEAETSAPASGDESGMGMIEELAPGDILTVLPNHEETDNWLLVDVPEAIDALGAVPEIRDELREDWEKGYFSLIDIRDLEQIGFGDVYGDYDMYILRGGDMDEVGDELEGAGAERFELRGMDVVMLEGDEGVWAIRDDAALFVGNPSVLLDVLWRLTGDYQALQGILSLDREEVVSSLSERPELTYLLLQFGISSPSLIGWYGNSRDEKLAQIYSRWVAGEEDLGEDSWGDEILRYSEWLEEEEDQIEGLTMRLTVDPEQLLAESEVRVDPDSFPPDTTEEQLERMRTRRVLDGPWRHLRDDGEEGWVWSMHYARYLSENEDVLRALLEWLFEDDDDRGIGLGTGMEALESLLQRLESHSPLLNHELAARWESLTGIAKLGFAHGCALEEGFCLSGYSLSKGGGRDLLTTGFFDNGSLRDEEEFREDSQSLLPEETCEASYQLEGRVVTWDAAECDAEVLEALLGLN